MTRSPAQRRARRRLLGWLPITFVALICVGVVIAAVLMQNSWWTDSRRPAAADQQAADGTSMFGGPGIDYLTRQGVLRIRIGEDSLPARTVGLEERGRQTFRPITPIEAVVVAPDGAFYLDLVRSFTVVTDGDRVESVELVREADGAWQSVFPQLRDVAPSWGWTDADLERLQDDLTVASAAEGGGVYSARTAPVAHKGAEVSAEVSVDVPNADVTATFVISATR